MPIQFVTDNTMQILRSNTLLQGGKYKIERVLGQGGFGITYLAEQPALGRKVAVKEFFMSSHCMRQCDSQNVECATEQNREFVSKCKQKFLKEARTIARLTHKNIPVVHDIFEENNTAYYVMEYIEGSSLDKCNRRFSEEESLNIIRQVADALQYIHSQNILHLDVKPANIILKEDGTAMLIDFGISKHYTMDGHQSSTSPIGVSRGYAPIEQYSQDVKSFNPATDIYSLGATLYWLLTGQCPPESLLLRDSDLAECPNGVSETTWSVVKCSMKRDRQDRVQNIKEFLKLLNRKKVYKKNKKVQDSTLLIEKNQEKSERELKQEAWDYAEKIKSTYVKYHRQTFIHMISYFSHLFGIACIWGELGAEQKGVSDGEYLVYFIILELIFTLITVYLYFCPAVEPDWKKIEEWKAKNKNHPACIYLKKHLIAPRPI